MTEQERNEVRKKKKYYSSDGMGFLTKELRDQYEKETEMIKRMTKEVNAQ